MGVWGWGGGREGGRGVRGERGGVRGRGKGYRRSAGRKEGIRDVGRLRRGKRLRAQLYVLRGEGGQGGAVLHHGFSGGGVVGGVGGLSVWAGRLETRLVGIG